MENQLIQAGGVLVTLAVTLVGIFKGLIPRLIDNYDKRLQDKDNALKEHRAVIARLNDERKEITDKFLASLETVVKENREAMTELRQAVEHLADRVADIPPMLTTSFNPPAKGGPSSNGTKTSSPKRTPRRKTVAGK